VLARPLLRVDSVLHYLRDRPTSLTRGNNRKQFKMFPPSVSEESFYSISWEVYANLTIGYKVSIPSLPAYFVYEDKNFLFIFIFSLSYFKTIKHCTTVLQFHFNK